MSVVAIEVEVMVRDAIAIDWVDKSRGEGRLNLEVLNTGACQPDM